MLIITPHSIIKLQIYANNIENPTFLGDLFPGLGGIFIDNHPKVVDQLHDKVADYSNSVRELRIELASQSEFWGGGGVKRRKFR